MHLHGQKQYFSLNQILMNTYFAFFPSCSWNASNNISFNFLSHSNGCFTFWSQTFRHETFRYGHFGPRDISVQGHFGTRYISAPGHFGPRDISVLGHFGTMDISVPGHFGPRDISVPGHFGTMDISVPGHFGPRDISVPGHFGTRYISAPGHFGTGVFRYQGRFGTWDISVPVTYHGFLYICTRHINLKHTYLGIEICKTICSLQL